MTQQTFKTFVSLNDTLGEAHVTGIYAHGDAEDFLGYDLIAAIDGETFLPDGVTCVTLKRPLEKLELPCLAFVWTLDGKHKRGYVVSSTDAPSIEYATKQMTNRVPYI